MRLFSHHNDTSVRRSVKILRGIVALILFVITGFFLRNLASTVIHFVGVYITNSAPAQGYGRVNWDISLRIAAYLLYATSFLVLVTYIHSNIRTQTKTINDNKIFAALFILWFPTVTNWFVTYTCGGFLGNCTKSYWVVAPIIMSVNPMSIIIGCVAAYGLIKAYQRYA